MCALVSVMRSFFVATGYFGAVYCGKHKASQEYVAIKMVSLRYVVGSVNGVSRALTEKMFLLACDSKFIVKLYVVVVADKCCEFG